MATINELALEAEEAHGELIDSGRVRRGADGVYAVHDGAGSLVDLFNSDQVQEAFALGAEIKQREEQLASEEQSAKRQQASWEAATLREAEGLHEIYREEYEDVRAQAVRVSAEEVAAARARAEQAFKTLDKRERAVHATRGSDKAVADYEAARQIAE